MGWPSLVSNGVMAEGGTSGRRSSSTRKRLIVTFGVVIAVFVVALGLQIAGLRRMEKTFAAMAACEEQMRLVLELEDSVREQFECNSHSGGVRTAEYEAASARAVELARTIGERLTDPEAMAWLSQVRDASLELDRGFSYRVVSGVRKEEPIAASTPERLLALLLVAEQNVDRIFERLQRAMSTLRRQLMELERSALRWTVGLLFATPMFVALAVAYLSRSIARPLARLSEGAARLTAGKLDTRIDIDTPDEFGALASEFNAMTVALEQHQRRLVESEKLAVIGRVSAGVAHELNNPLQVILGYLSLNRDIADRRLAEQLAATEEEALRCKAIVDGMLELSRPAAIGHSSVDLGAVCGDVARSARMLCPSGTFTLSVRDAACILGDGPKLRQALFNLVKNGIEAGGPNGRVDVEVDGSADAVTVAVSDSGPGITPAVSDRLFEPFFTTKAAGTGLGLALARATARAHGGDIAITNRPTGGASFTLVLPRAPGTGTPS